MTPIDYHNPNDPWMQTGYDPYKGLSDDERMKVGCLQVAGYIATLLLGLALCALLGSCTTTRTVTVERVHTDTLYQTRTTHDSIYFADSIHISDFVRGDTVWSVRDRWHTRYIERIRTDTLYQATRDTIPVPYEVTKEVQVEKPLTPWQHFRLTLANILLYTLGILAVGWVIKKKLTK